MCVDTYNPFHLSSSPSLLLLPLPSPPSPSLSRPYVLQCITFPFDLLIKGVVNGNHLAGVDILKNVLGIVSWLFVAMLIAAYR